MASGKNAIGNCERCGFQYPLRNLLVEIQPNKAEITVCKTCLDPFNLRDDPGAFDTDEDMSIEDPVFTLDLVSMWAWEPVGNVATMKASSSYRWLS